jgi:hypothetical protein
LTQSSVEVGLKTCEETRCSPDFRKGIGISTGHAPSIANLHILIHQGKLAPSPDTRHRQHSAERSVAHNKGRDGETLRIAMIGSQNRWQEQRVCASKFDRINVSRQSDQPRHASRNQYPVDNTQ